MPALATGTILLYVPPYPHLPFWQGLKRQLHKLKAAYSRGHPSVQDEEPRGVVVVPMSPGDPRHSRHSPIVGSTTVQYLRRRLTFGSIDLENEPDVNGLEMSFSETLDAQVM